MSAETKKYEKEFDENLVNDLRIQADSVMDTLTNFILGCKELFMDTSTWTVGRDSMKYYCRIKKSFTAI